MWCGGARDTHAHYGVTVRKTKQSLNFSSFLCPYGTGDSKTKIIRYIRIKRKYPCLRVDSELESRVEPFDNFTNMSVFTSSGDCQYKF